MKIAGTLVSRKPYLLRSLSCRPEPSNARLSPSTLNRLRNFFADTVLVPFSAKFEQHARFSRNQPSGQKAERSE